MLSFPWPLELPDLPPTMIPKTAWSNHVEFGHCPACGEVGIEEQPSPKREFALFRCLDPRCTSYIPVPTEKGGTMVASTRWCEKKPRIWRRSEMTRGSSWNYTKFSEAGCRELNL